MTQNRSQLFLITLLVFMGALFTKTIGHAQQELILTIATLALIGISLLLERRYPLHKTWNQGTGDTAGDIGSFVVIFGLLDSALKWLSPFVILALMPDVARASDWPLIWQILAATLLIELGAYASHYAHHKFAPLWAVHAMHHSTERLYTLNNFRFHPLNHVLNYLAMFTPLILLGITPTAILGYTALSMPVLLFQHSNINFRFGAFSKLLNTNTVHRWHHSAAYKEGMHNFGRATVIYDHLFGTYHNPDDATEPARIGLGFDAMKYPRANRTLKQILWPFCKSCCA